MVGDRIFFIGEGGRLVEIFGCIFLLLVIDLFYFMLGVVIFGWFMFCDWMGGYGLLFLF